MKKRILVTIFSLSFQAFCADKHSEPPRIGNFSLPTSQQPGSFLSLGQNIFDEGQLQLNLMVDDYMARHSHSIDLAPYAIYAVSDQFSVLLNIPFALDYEQDDSHSSGIEDLYVQLEYGYYSKQNSRFTDQATVLAYTSFPTGSRHKVPPTGIGTVSFLLGTTFLRTYIDWYGFVSSGVGITTSHNGTNFGNKYLYQFGLGRNISACPSKWILAWLVEIDGLYSDKSLIEFEKNDNSGGNVVYITPSLWFSKKHLIIQAGVGKACAQHLFGIQPLNTYLWAANLAWTF
jgi:hypothetical protein